jgi:pimeloyl-ACP methyl ester carboxylesterase
VDNLILFIPGNPSIPGIYDPFLDELKNQLQAEIGDSQTIHYEVLYHLGQLNSEHKKLGRINLQDVIEDHKSTIKDLLLRHKANKVFLVSHSLGSAISISLRDHFKSDIDRFMLLCPFLGPRGKNASFLRVFKNPIVRNSLLLGSHIILSNQKASDLFFDKWLGGNELNSLIIREVKKPHYLKNFFSLVANYFESFSQLNIRESLSLFDSSKSYFIFAKKDFWVPIETISLIPKDSKRDILENLSHDFCLVKSEFTELVKFLVKDLKDCCL